MPPGMIICKALRRKGTPFFSYGSTLKRDGLKGCKGGCVLAGHLWLLLALPLGHAG